MSYLMAISGMVFAFYGFWTLRVCSELGTAYIEALHRKQSIPYNMAEEVERYGWRLTSEAFASLLIGIVFMCVAYYQNWEVLFG